MRLSALQAVISYWGRSARWRQSCFAWFFMEWIDVQIKGNECSTWNKACRITTYGHTCSPTPVAHTQPTVRTKPGKSGGFPRLIVPIPLRFAGFSRLFARFFVGLAGFGTNKLGKSDSGLAQNDVVGKSEKIEFRISSKHCSHKVGEIRFQPNSKQCSLKQVKGIGFQSNSKRCSRQVREIGFRLSSKQCSFGGGFRLSPKRCGCQIEGNRISAQNKWRSSFGGEAGVCGLGLRGFLLFFYGIFFSGVEHACHRDRGAGWADLPASAGRQLIDLHTGDFLRVTRVGRHGGQKVPFLFDNSKNKTICFSYLSHYSDLEWLAP